MIRCNRCGTTNATGILNCQTCGEPLVRNTGYESGSRMGAQSSPSNMGIQGHSGQPEIPAWLETLRAGERGTPPAGNPANFSTADLVEEGALPSWMRPERGDAGDLSASGPYLAIRSAAHSGPDTDDRNVGAKGLLARSLIDEQALPSWMREGKEGAEAIPVPGSLNAASLLQTDSVPEWMKTVQQQQQQLSSSGMSAQGMPAESPQARPVYPTPPPVSSGGFSARDLIDPQALPAWMAQQGMGQQGMAQPGSQPVREEMRAIPQGQQVQAGMPASSLLDAASLPYWLREGEQSGAAQQPDQSSWQSGAADFSSIPASSPMAMQAPVNPNMNNMPPAWPAAQAQGAPLTASSFIDMDSLPEWLRSATDQSQTGGARQKPNEGIGAPPYQRQGGYQIPQRAENVNVRVPSRPRGEINPSEGSEVAANVFASMLGVASAAPNFPAAGAPTMGASDAPTYMTQSGPMSPQGMPPQSMSDPMGAMQGTPQGYIPGSYPPAYPQQGYPENAPQQQGYGQPPGYGQQQGYAPQQGYPMGGPQYQAAPGMAPHPYQVAPGAGTGKKPAKRGFFEAIRDWLNR